MAELHGARAADLDFLMGLCPGLDVLGRYGIGQTRRIVERSVAFTESLNHFSLSPRDRGPNYYIKYLASDLLFTRCLGSPNILETFSHCAVSKASMTSMVGT